MRAPSPGRISSGWKARTSWPPWRGSSSVSTAWRWKRSSAGQPDENHAAFYRFLLELNGRMYGVHFSLDPVGDVYLTGRMPLSAATPAEIDRLLGSILSYADDNFDTALERGFASSIRREWAWRVKRGESLANLRAFARFADPDR